MRWNENRAEDVKIAYIGGGSRGWAWGLMSDLASAEDMNGSVYLYDIDFEAAKNNETIGNGIAAVEGCRSAWKYKAVPEIGEALSGADFVVISILPGTFDEMESDVHAPEEYGLYQSVGDTSGPGGIIRAMRTVPMMEVIAKAIEKYCPKAWVINYTNPMTVCIRTLYKTFPEIKAFGCCHEVFGTQQVLQDAVKEELGLEVTRDEVKVNVVGVNHFTWLTSAQYRNIDLYPVYRAYAEKYRENGVPHEDGANWVSSANYFLCLQKVKFDLFLRYGVIAAAGDRHLAEFCPGDWYLKDPQMVEDWRFGLTPVSWRKEDLAKRLEKSRKLLSGEIKFELNKTGEEGVHQMRALLGLCDLVTNVNLPNRGQIPNLPLGAVVETNAAFRADAVQPVMAGPVPESILPLISRVSAEQEILVDGCIKRDKEKVFQAFAGDPLVRLPIDTARELFDKMVANTEKYLQEYK